MAFRAGPGRASGRRQGAPGAGVMQQQQEEDNADARIHLYKFFRGATEMPNTMQSSTNVPSTWQLS